MAQMLPLPHIACSRIRDYMDITPKCPVLLISPAEENFFNVRELFEKKEY